MVLGQRRQSRRDAVSAEAGTGADAQQADGFAARLRDGVSQLIDVVEDALRPLLRRLALLGERHAARCPVQQRCFHAAFEDGDALADDGVGEPQLTRRGGEAAVAGNGAEQAEVFK